MEVDYTDVVDLKPVPDGTYAATLIDHKIVPKSKSSGEPYVSLVFVLTEDKYEGRQMFRNFSLQKQSLWAFKKALITLGADPDIFTGKVDVDEVCTSARGYGCVLVIGSREYQGELRNEIRAIRPEDGLFH